jgi:hypothetical protein
MGKALAAQKKILAGYVFKKRKHKKTRKQLLKQLFVTVTYSFFG